jgi:hypothetical protein
MNKFLNKENLEIRTYSSLCITLYFAVYVYILYTIYIPNTYTYDLYQLPMSF